MKKIAKTLMTTIFSLALVLQLVGGMAVRAAEEDSVRINLNLTEEIAQAEKIMDQFMSTRCGDVIYDNPQEVAAEYIPKGSWCTNVCRIGDVLYIDYRVDNIRYIVGYYNDGNIEKVARALGEDTIYSVYSNDERVETLDLQETRREYFVSEQKTVANLEKNLEYEGNSVQRSSGKVVEPVLYTSVASTIPYKAKIVMSGYVTISAFNGTSYNTSQPYRIYETMSYHSEVKKTTQAFAVGATLAKVASAFFVEVNTVKAWFTVAGVLFSTGNILQEACQVVNEHEYTFLGGKECGIYDPTVNNAYVETYSTWSQGKIVMIWLYDSSTGYNNPTWGHSVPCTSLQTGNATVRDYGLDAYNGNIIQNGQWSWGVGNGFGY